MALFVDVLDSSAVNNRNAWADFFGKCGADVDRRNTR